MNILTRIAVAVAHWLLRRCGNNLDTRVAQAPVPAEDSAAPTSTTEVPTHLTLTRDRYGRFRPKDAPPPGTDPQSDLLEEAGITPKMQQAARVGYTPPDDAHDKDQVERRLREYIVANLGTWVDGRHCSLWMAFAALKDTYAIDMKRYTALLQAAKAGNASDKQQTRQTGLPVRNGLPVRTEVKGNYWYAYPASGQPPSSVGAERSLGPLWPENKPAADSPQRRQAALPPYAGVASTTGARAFCPPVDACEVAASSAEQSLPSGQSVANDEQRAASPRSASPALAWRRGAVAVDTLEHAATGAGQLRPYDVSAVSASSDPGGTAAAATEAIQSGSTPSVSRCLGGESTVPLSTDPPRAAASTGAASSRHYANDGFDLRVIQAEIDALLAPINAAYAAQSATLADLPAPFSAGGQRGPPQAAKRKPGLRRAILTS